jgi:hypothetical protein
MRSGMPDYGFGRCERKTTPFAVAAALIVTGFRSMGGLAHQCAGFPLDSSGDSTASILSHCDVAIVPSYGHYLAAYLPPGSSRRASHPPKWPTSGPGWFHEIKLDGFR